MPRVLVVLCSAIVLTGAAVVAVFGRSGPGLDPAREQAVRASVESHLEQDHWHGVLEAQYVRQRVGWFCAGEVIEADENPDESAVGLQTLCQEFTSVAGELVLGSGESVPRIVTVTSPPKPVEVLRVESAPDGAGNAEWIDDHFSWLGAKKLHRTQYRDLRDETIAKALSAFGLPAGTPVRPRI
ncbi:MAG: hypothetical protein QOF58_7265 [Pseudonocardiales bacterium]|jgi:hypothetical protein|nr:hypothetical protein [Pseudonocardiales bacterium]